MNKKAYSQTYPIELMDFLILGLILLSYISHFLLGQGSFITSTFRLLSIAFAVFCAGRMAVIYQNTTSIIWKKAGCFLVLYVLSGLAYDLIVKDIILSKSLSKMLTLIDVPKHSELFFTITVLFSVCALTAKHVNFLKKHKLLLCIFSFIALFLAYLPDDLFVYPLVGVFLGCNTYRCIPLLPAFGFFVAGLYSTDFAGKDIKKWSIISIVISFVSLAMYFLGMPEIARYAIVAFPVYFIFILYYLYATRLPKVHFTNQLKLPIRKNILVYFLLYSAVFAITAFFVFSVFRENQISFVWKPDGYSQYYQKAYYFSTYVRDAFNQILQGDFNLPAYDFSLGMGQRIAFSYEPLFCLFALFDPSNIENAYTYILILRYFCTGLSMSVLLLYFKNSFYQTLFGSIMYTFCGFALMDGVRHPQYLGPMIMLPLLIIATEEIIRQKRWYLLPPITAVSLLCGYYFHYINTIMIGIYYLVRFIYTSDTRLKNWKTFIRTTFIFAGTYILGVLIGNATLITSFASYLGSSRSEYKSLTTDTFFAYQSNWFKKCISSFISLPETPGYILKFGFIPLTVIAIVLLFIRKEKKELKFVFLLFSAFCIFPIAGYILSGFSTVTNRWSYAYALLVTVITVYVLPKLSNLTKQELRIILISITPYLLFVSFDRSYRSISTITSAVLLLLTYIIILLMNNDMRIISCRLGKAALLLLSFISITLNSFYLYTDGGDTNPENYVAAGEVYEQTTDTPLKALLTIDDDNFYRIATPRSESSNLNSAQLLDYNGITEFSSTVNGNIMDSSILNGISTTTLVRIKGFDNRTYLNSLANVKYYSSNAAFSRPLPYGYKEFDQATLNDKKYILYKNEYALPLGYTYNSVISETDLLNFDTLSRQEVMMQSAVLKDNSELLNSFIPSISLKDTSKEIKITNYETSGLEFVDDNTIHMTQPTATLTLYFDTLPNSETYLEFVGSLLSHKEARDVRVSINTFFNNTENKYELSPINNVYNTRMESTLFNLGYQKDSVASCTLTFESSTDKITVDEPNIFTVESLKVFCQPLEDYPSYIDALTEDTLENIELSSNCITGNISLKQNKLLALSIPYEKGWTAYVDGNETPIEKVNLMYMGLPISAGNHEIKLVYEVPGQTLSRILSVTGILIYIFTISIYHLKKKGKRS